MTDYTFEALKDFNESLDELRILIKLSNDFKKFNRLEKQSLMFRSIVLFLGTHLECFFESIAEEYLFKIEQCSLPRDRIPINLLMSSVHHHFNEELISNIQSKKPACKVGILKLAEILSCDSPVTELKIDTRFSYGKHGSKIVKKLFERLDIPDIFSLCKVFTEQETMLSDTPESVEVNIKGKFDLLTSARNQLIHEYKAPSQATIEGIIDDIELYRSFGDSLANLLNSKLERICET
ncbi:hypothetical protein OTEC02_09020 [Acinetobacter lactucae]|uniref:HEPN domain-containing protein n=1 Tax=Acinetobacter lactucae TaxID=1785128 RepID=UPI0009BEAB66|nr:HEPN domain-containing protein [Acinetobacter lactucae]ARD28899.1 hypothetical protein OTEC02_09020 [Acinetobacter lactucae]